MYSESSVRIELRQHVPIGAGRVQCLKQPKVACSACKVKPSADYEHSCRVTQWFYAEDQRRNTGVRKMPWPFASFTQLPNERYPPFRVGRLEAHLREGGFAWWYATGVIESLNLTPRKFTQSRTKAASPVQVMCAIARLS